jgi:hypothetical protein
VYPVGSYCADTCTCSFIILLVKLMLRDYKLHFCRTCALHVQGLAGPMYGIWLISTSPDFTWLCWCVVRDQALTSRNTHLAALGGWPYEAVRDYPLCEGYVWDNYDLLHT